MYEFHVSRFSRDRYGFDQAIYQLNGNVILADFAAAREFSDRINRARDLVRFPDAAISAGEIHAMGLIDEILHVLVADYRKNVDPQIMSRAQDVLERELGADRFEGVLKTFTGHFPPLQVYRGAASADEYLAAKTAGLPNREIALEELLMLWLANANPAFARHAELFDDRILENQSAYRRMVDGFDRYFSSQPGPERDSGSLLELLLAPARKHPDSLTAQLEYLLETFADLLGRFQVRILRSLDLLREEQRPVFSGPGPVTVVDFARLGLQAETEHFSPDLDWMPRLVLVAKNAHVWLDQLSKSQQREIRRLDQIPQEELDLLAQRGFTGLWLIGLWERSPASRMIKHLTGNPDAVSSAYSLFDYTIAADLGGDPAYEVLHERAARAGIRLAADMVPNHTGIYSKWVLEHPDWFISTDRPPYPVYAFAGPDLSEDPGIGIYLEDQYYSQTDAAVVFKRVDRRTGDVRYLYHGNDGTSMPWNDTAQLDYLNPEVREAVIRTIIGVARKFSVIRFDAAMTLAKKHIQRLWFPEPGQGGAIPSRAEHGLTASAFDLAIPKEFWREVVDRVAEEAPDTLLLAEAFWLMEGYFVRTLGMHRVYNSAFMNMLRDEKNAEYRSVIKNTLEFDPQILKRYVNFMNNPDEETAAVQFGKDGKYFGICTLMATMPGLPMFGHGQIEGFREKYGMEYQRAYYDETPDADLVDRHRREIFPLLHRRAQFAEVSGFLFYDFITADGGVDENVFAYSNLHDGQRSLVLVHNRWGETRGRVNQSTSTAVKSEAGKAVHLTRSLAAGLDLPDDPAAYVTFREVSSGLQYIRSCAELHNGGFEAELGAFDYRVYLDFNLVFENEWSHYRMLTDTLGGRGVNDLEAIRQEIVLLPILTPWRQILSADLFEEFYATFSTANAADAAALADTVSDFTNAAAGPIQGLLDGASDHLARPFDQDSAPGRPTSEFETMLADARPALTGLDRHDAAVLYCWLAARLLARLAPDADTAQRSVRGWLDDWLLGHAMRDFLSEQASDADERYQLTLLLSGREPAEWLAKDAQAAARAWLGDAETARYLSVNRYQAIVWFDADRLARLAAWIRRLNGLLDPSADALGILDEIEAASGSAAYQVDALLTALGGEKA